MRKITFILTMVAVAGLGLTGCGNKETSSNVSADTQVAVVEEVKETKEVKAESSKTELTLDESNSIMLMFKSTFGTNYPCAGSKEPEFVSASGNIVTVNIPYSDMQLDVEINGETATLVEARNLKGADLPTVFCQNDMSYSNVQKAYDYCIENNINNAIYASGCICVDNVAIAFIE